MLHVARLGLIYVKNDGYDMFNLFFLMHVDGMVGMNLYACECIYRYTCVTCWVFYMSILIFITAETLNTVGNHAKDHTKTYHNT